MAPKETDGGGDEAPNNSDTVESILKILADQILIGFPLNAARLRREVGAKVADGKPVEMLLPAFPCKSINKDKVLGVRPDLGEFLALRKIVQALRDIEAVYPAGGALLTIFSDFHTFAKYISVGAGEYQQYYGGLNTLVARLGASDVIKVANYRAHEEFADSRDDYDYQQILERLYGDADFSARLDSKVETCARTKARFEELMKMMGHDQKHIMDEATRVEEVSRIAKGMMVSGKALDNFLNEKYPDSIRLSVHQYKEEGTKSAISLLEENTVKTPWHNAVLFDAATGKFVFDERKILMARDGLILTVKFEGRDWLLLQLRPRDQALAKKMEFLKLTLCKEAFGLIVESPKDFLNIRDIDNEDMSQMIKAFGVVIFRGFQKNASTKDLETWYSSRGQMVPWNFGHTKVVKDIPEMPDFVTSKEGLPIHFDLMMPPEYMGVDQSRHRYEDFVSREFLLYVHRSSGRGEGQSVLVDAALAPLTIGGAERERYRQTEVAYFTELTHFGGRSYHYPILHRCPWTGRDVFRWSEIWTESMHPGTVQTQIYEVLRSPDNIDSRKLEYKVVQILKSDLVTAVVDLECGDYVLVNNYTTLHGRTPFTGERELWRIELAPPSDNLPWGQPEVAEKIKQMLVSK